MIIFCIFVNQKFSTFSTLLCMKSFAERLKSARKMKGWSMQDLVNQLSKYVSRQALHKYESGAMMPSGNVLIALAEALDVKPDYFMKEPISLGAVEFRKRAKLPVRQVEMVKEKVKDFLQRYLEVEELLNINIVFDNPVDDMVIRDIEEVEKVVNELLIKWNLGFNAIPNVIEMLEEKGVRVIEIDAPEAFDGLSTFVNNIPVVVINQRFTVERKRFTALHELGHLILNIEEGADKEKICHAFAGAMLLPANSLEALIGEKRNNIAPGELISIKEQFGISIQAIIKRAELKGIISKASAERFWRSIAGNKKEEGLGAYSGKEKSYRFEHLVFRLAAEDVVSMSKAANLAGMKLADFREHLDAVDC